MKAQEHTSKTSTSEGDTGMDPVFTPTSSAQGEATAVNAGDVDDEGPEASPYVTSTYTLEIGPSKAKYTVQAAFLQQYPALLDLLNWFGSVKRCSLPDVDENVGHTLVHYFYTGEYQTLKSQDITSDARRLTRYRRGLLTYCVAKKYAITGLEHLAKLHTRKYLYDNDISIYNKLDVALEVSAKLPEDAWFTEHLRLEVALAFELNEDLFASAEFLDKFGVVKSLDMALVKIITEIYASKLKARTTATDPANQHQWHECGFCEGECSYGAIPSADLNGSPMSVATNTGIAKKSDDSDPCTDAVEEPRSPTISAEPVCGDECHIEPVSIAAETRNDAAASTDVTDNKYPENTRSTTGRLDTSTWSFGGTKKNKKRTSTSTFDLGLNDPEEGELSKGGEEAKTEETSDDWSSWGTKKDKHKKKRSGTAEIEPTIEVLPEKVDVTGTDDTWDIWGSKKDKQKELNIATDLPPTPEPAAGELEETKIEDSWGFGTKVKTKKNRATELSPTSSSVIVENTDTRVEDEWGTFGVKRKGKKIPLEESFPKVEESPPVPPTTETEPEFFWGSAAKKKDVVEEVKPEKTHELVIPDKESSSAFLSSWAPTWGSTKTWSFGAGDTRSTDVTEGKFTKVRSSTTDPLDSSTWSFGGDKKNKKKTTTSAFDFGLDDLEEEDSKEEAEAKTDDVSNDWSSWGGKKEKDQKKKMYEEQEEQKKEKDAKTEDTSTDWNSWGTKKDKKKKKKKTSGTEEVIEPPVAVLQEIVDVTGTDDTWGTWGWKKDSKKKPNKATVPPPTSQPAAVEPEETKVEDSWGFGAKAKNKKNKATDSSPIAKSVTTAATDTKVDDDWGTFGVKSKAKKCETILLEEDLPKVEELPPVPSTTETEPEFSWGSAAKKDKKKGKKCVVEEVKPEGNPEVVVSDPVADFDFGGWGITGKKDKKKGRKSDEPAVVDASKEEPVVDSWNIWGTTLKSDKKDEDLINVVDPSTDEEAANTTWMDTAWGSKKTDKSKGNAKKSTGLDAFPPPPPPAPPTPPAVMSFLDSSKDDAPPKKCKDKKTKKGKNTEAEITAVLDPVIEVVPDQPEEDTWGSWGLSKTGKKKREKEAQEKAAHEDEPNEAETEEVVVVPDPPVEDTWCLPLGLSSKGKKEKAAKKKAAKRKETQEEVEAAVPEPLVEDCEFRAEHLLESDLWKECQFCRARVRRMSLQLLEERHGY